MRDDMREIRIASITVKDNLRRDSLDVSDLVESIRDRGLLQPILVRRCSDGYELVAGHRRLEACKQLRMQRIPAVVQDTAESDRIYLQFAENIQRKSLSPYDVACGLRKMRKQLSSMSAVARAIRKGPRYVEDHLVYADLFDELADSGIPREQIAAVPLVTMLELRVLEAPGRADLVRQIVAPDSNGKPTCISQLRVRKLLRDRIPPPPMLDSRVRASQRRRGVKKPGGFTFSVMARTLVVACENDQAKERVIQRLLELGGRRT